MRAVLRTTLLILVIGPASAALAFSNDQPLMCDGLEATIVGTEGDDLLIGTDGDDVIVALGGNDIVRAHDGNDRICLGPGDDTAQGGYGSDVIRGGAGADSIGGGRDRSPNYLYGGPGDDYLRGAHGVDFIYGMGGDDRILGAGYHDRLRGGQGADTIRGGHGKDRLHGGAGDDQLFGKRMRDIIKAGPGDDFLHGGLSFDQLTGGLGEDTCDSGPWPWTDAMDCEVIIELPGPPDWYRVGVIGTGHRGTTFRLDGPIDVDPQTGHIWGSDVWGNVSSFDLNGELQAEVDMTAVGDGTGSAHSVVVDGGEVFVVLDVEQRIVVLSTAGEILREWGGSGTEDGQFQQLCGLAVSSDFVFAHDDNIIKVFDRMGRYLYQFPIDGAGCGLAVLDDELFVGGSDNLVLVYDFEGESIRAIGQSLPFFKQYITSDRSGKIWVAERRGNAAAMSPDGRVVDLPDLQLAKQPDRLHGLAADPHGHAIWANVDKIQTGDGVHRIWSYSTLGCQDKRLTYVGSSANDTLATTSLDAVVHLGPGDDFLQAGDGADTICGGPGNDTLLAGAGNDVLFGGSGDDALHGESDEDECTGGAGTDEAFDCELLAGIP